MHHMADAAGGGAAYPKLKMHIDGGWIEAGSRRVHRVLNPATSDVIGEVPLADAADLDRALAAAEAGFRVWRKSSGAERAAVLSGAARLLHQRAEDIAINATREQGKTLAETRI